MRGRLRSIWRLLDFAFSTFIGIIGFFLAIFLGKPKEIAGLRFRRRWLQRVPRRLGLHMNLEGEPYSGPCLYVANHISYIDPIGILSYVDAKIVAKAEIADWPLVGYSASITGTIFVKREHKDSRSSAAQAVRESLMRNESILVFPEGTTSEGPLTLPFRPRTFEAAQAANIPVQPVALYYEDPSVAYIGEDKFLSHFIALSRKKSVLGHIAFGPLLRGEGTCEKAKAWINQYQSRFIPNSVVHEPA